MSANRFFEPKHPLQKYLLFCAPSPPAPPDTVGAAKEQGQANVEAARVGSKLNNPNVITPYGQQTVEWKPAFDETAYNNSMNKWWVEHQKKNGLNVSPMPQKEWYIKNDQPTITQTLNPEQQAILDESNKAKLSLSQLATRGSNVAGDVLGKNLDLSGLPARPGSAEDTRTKVIDAMMSRVNEDVDRQQGQINSNLYAAGHASGSKAYNDAMALSERARTDARQQAILAGGQEMTRDFQTDSARRREALAELLAERQTPLNEITAIMSGSQVNNPFSVPGYAQNAQVGAAPIFGAMQEAAGYNTDLYNAQAASAGNKQSGLAGLGGTVIMAGALM